jgi:hypothetical protein
MDYCCSLKPSSNYHLISATTFDASKSYLWAEVQRITYCIPDDLFSSSPHSVEKRGDAYTFKIVLDLPFAAEPFLATDFLYKSKKEIPTVHTYTGPNFPDEASYIDSCEPYNFCDSLVLLFQEQEDNFEVAEIAVSSMKLLNLTNSSDDESFEW